MSDLLRLSQEAIDAVIRPPRRHYDLDSLPLKLSTSEGQRFTRSPLNFINSRKQKIVCSVYTNASREIMDGGPMVVYLHGNASSQNEGQFLLPNLLPYGISVFLFDFAGCGESEGDYISLGLFESEDLKLLLKKLQVSYNFGPFVLWGRSMGATTALMTDLPSDIVVGNIIDSAFSSLYDVCLSISTNFGIPRGINNFLIWLLKLMVSDLANFDINDVCPIEHAKKSGKPPALFGHALDDEFIPFQQAKDIFDVYSNKEKEFFELQFGHNSKRSNIWLKKCYEFIFNKLKKYDDDDDSKQVLFDFEKKFRMKKICGVGPLGHFNSFQEMVEFSKMHGGEDKALRAISLESLMEIDDADM